MENGPKKVVLYVNDKTFEDQTVYVSGHYYLDCTFKRCTMVLTSFDFLASGCTMDSCVWHIDALVHDHEEWDQFLHGLAIKILGALPRLEAGQ